MLSIVNQMSMLLFLHKAKRGDIVISYKPFYETLFKKDITEYELIFKHGISANTLHRMKKGEAITTKTLDTLCFILNCSVSDILEFQNNPDDEPSM